MTREPFVVASMRKINRKRSPRWLILSVLVHVAVILALSTIVFNYPVGQLVGWRRPGRLTQERITYVNVAPVPAPRAGNPAADTGAGPAAAPSVPARRPATARPVAPARVPQGVPPADPAPAPGGVPGGKGGGGGAGGSDAGTGMVPSFSDARVWAPPGQFTPAPRSNRQVVDSVIDVAVGAYIDSVRVAAANKGRDPGDWTVGKDGNKWGIDPKWIHFGKVKVPTALLALLPVNAQQNPSFNARDRAATRWDIQYHAQRAITEDEFRRSVKRIRERVERERAARLAGNANGGGQQPAAGPTP